jgi:ecotin
MGGEPRLFRYNSRLPIVVYAPEGVEIRYRIWSAGPEAKMTEALAKPPSSVL